ncbi:hypothetical protein N665_0011s0021 [Sinapis alba]|nr:hypothetical protein N665_0011s0021 [Sinapis alba]
MDTSHCRHRGLIFLLVLFCSFLFGLASNMNISDDARGNRTDSNRKHILSSSNQHGKEYITCSKGGLEVPHTYVKCHNPKDLIAKINFVDYGNPTGECGKFRHGKCGTPPATMRLTKKNCLEKNKCMLMVSNEMFGTTQCKADIQLFVQITCRKP